MEGRRYQGTPARGSRHNLPTAAALAESRPRAISRTTRLKQSCLGRIEVPEIVEDHTERREGLPTARVGRLAKNRCGVAEASAVAHERPQQQHPVAVAAVGHASQIYLGVRHVALVHLHPRQGDQGRVCGG